MFTKWERSQPGYRNPNRLPYSAAHCPPGQLPAPPLSCRISHPQKAQAIAEPQLFRGVKTMATSTVSQNLLRGGSFLITPCTPDDVFTPADLTDDQRLIGQTAEEFVTKEVMPLVKDLENKKPGLMGGMVRKGAELGIMSGGIPEEYGGAGLDKIATTVLTEKLSIYGGFAVTHGAHAGIGTLPIVYFGTEEQKKKYLPQLASAELIGAYC